MKSIISNRKECYNCMFQYGLEEHHIFFGNANRSLSEKDGLKVWLCPQCHRGEHGVHGRDGHTLDIFLKEIAQQTWQWHYKKSKEDFIKRYGKSYL